MKSTYPTASIIIPVYNDQQRLNACLNSLKVQTVQEFEVIVVDNGSSPPMITPNDNNLKIKNIICSTKGSYAARNAGVKRASFEIIVFLDADCLPAPTWLESGLKSIMEHPEKTIIGGDVVLISSDNPTLVEQYQCLTGFGQQVNIQSKKFTATANLFVKREDIDDIGYFKETLLSGGDREWSWRAERMGFNLVYSKDAIVHTPPRTSLRAAIKQARRISGGRYHFKQLGLADSSLTEQRLLPQRNSWNSIVWLLKQNHLSIFNRVKILSVATLLKLVHVLETLRLQLGSPPERC